MKLVEVSQGILCFAFSLLLLFSAGFPSCTLAPPALPSAPPSPLPAASWNTGLDLGITYWRPHIAGDIRVGTKGFSGTKLDLVDDLDFDDTENITSYYVKAALGKDWDLFAEYMDIDQSGNTVLRQPIKFGGQVFPLDYALNSSLELTTLSIKVNRKLQSSSATSFGITGGILGIDGDSSLTAQSLISTDVRSESEDWRVLTPLLGFTYSVLSKGGWQLWLEAGGMKFKYSNTDILYLDGTLSLSYYIADNFALSAGYRYTNFVGDENETEFDYRLSGPMASLWFRF